ncbi:MAG: DUF4197 domain-containing protein [Flavobacteriaceae bacterium]|nr:DUF4197 domain-containing protein [Flavobacteriaceae bacterium]
MKNKFLLLALPFLLILNGCAELQSVINTLPQTGPVGEAEIGMGLKQALEFGVIEGVDILGQKDGYFKDQAVRILLPNELQKVDQTLRSIGLSALADEGLRVLNRAAEDAVTEAKPIFVSAIKGLTFQDAMGILTGNNQSATTYLKNRTTSSLVTAFEPRIQNSLDKVGANEVWSNIIEKYNSVPLVKPVNPNLTEYVTQKAIDGLFVKVGNKEIEIRNNISARTTPLLQRVFAMQDK